MLKFLADESCDFAIVKRLRSTGFDVKAVVEDMPGESDPLILRAAVVDERILLTEDKDFGEWVFAHKKVTSGVVLVRYPSDTRTRMIDYIVELVDKHGDELLGKFTVLEPGRARIRSIGRI